MNLGIGDIMKSKEIVDRYNPSKIWIISKSKCRHYYMQQKICGRIFGKKVRTTKKHLIDIGVLEN